LIKCWDFYENSGNKSASGEPFEGLTGNESNPDDAGRPIKVLKIDDTASHPYLMPGADPGEGFHNTNYQLFSTDIPTHGAVPKNQGFVINFKASIASDLDAASPASGAAPEESETRINGQLIVSCWLRKPMSFVLAGL